MTVVLFLIPLALVLAGGALAAFLWGVKSGQFDDLETPSHRMLRDEERTPGRALAVPSTFDGKSQRRL